VLASAPASEATYPGRNGRIAFTVLEAARATASYRTETVLPSGRGRRKLGDFAIASWAASGRLLLAGTLTWTHGVPLLGAVLADARGRVLEAIPAPSGLLSPDGRTVTYVEAVVDPVAQPEQEVDWIWTVRTDGTQLRRLARGTKPRWTPGGRRIVFQREDSVGGYHGIASMRADGRFRRQLIGADADAFFLDLAPDGRRLLWHGHRRGPGRRKRVLGMFTSDLHGRHPQLISRRDPQGAATWSPDGRKIAFAFDDVDLRGTFIVSATGGQLQRLLRRPRFGLAWQPRPRQ
jgi:Tol biopolymer transport system component